MSIESTCLTAQSTSLTSALYITMWTPLSHWENIHVLFCVFCGLMLPLGSYFVSVSRILWAEIGGNSCESGGLQWLSWVCIMFVCCVVEFWVDSQTDRDGLKLLHVLSDKEKSFFFFFFLNSGIVIILLDNQLCRFLNFVAQISVKVSIVIIIVNIKVYLHKNPL